MAAAERLDRILDAVRVRRFLSVDDAVELTGSSPASIRRDFARLAEQGALRRVRGGVRPTGTANMLPFEIRESRQLPEKQAIARYAASLLRPGDVVIIDGGTTTFQLAVALPPIPLRIITNSISLAHYLDQHARRSAQIEIFLTGGYLYPNSGLLVGPGARATIAQYHVDWAFLSVAGITRDGFHNTNEMVVETEQQMLASADRSVVLADHSKVGRGAMCRICPLGDVHQLITDAAPDSLDRLKQFADAGLKFETVPVLQD